ncbi:Nitrate reductase cytochrome c550-type subunit [hydrothermal vent metagenome]|uniref:Periplasmic nitrate reductase, electron transfer subunit n=1 Tax=hydrothermal vent metagenome TaxID=652676 RepID=A0A3B1E8W6_9ZZZZ
MTKQIKILNKLTLSAIVAFGIFFVGCTNNVVDTDNVVDEKSLGLRKTDLYSEKEETHGDKTKYGNKMAGTSKKINRAFQDAPPMIPHDVEGMLPIQINNNQCTSCHMPEVASSMGATPLPKSHFIDFRPKHKIKNNTFVKTIDNMKNEVSIKKTDKLQNSRFNCTQCHAPQSNATNAPANTFKAVFSNKDGATKSSWSGSRLTDDLDTLAK